MAGIQFNRQFACEYGVAETLSPLIRRIVAPNPGAFTFHGTGTYLIGHRRVAVIDPGPPIAAHVEAIVQAVAGQSISHILVTHTHADHSPAAALLQARCGAPTFGFAPHSRPPAGVREAGADYDFVPDIRLADGDMIVGEGWRLQAVHTPGHCANHLCFALPPEQVLFCGDQLMAWSTTVIAPPDGNLAAYLHSLEQLKRRSESIYWPTHGAPITRPTAYIEQTIRHRLARVEQVAAAVRRGDGRIADLRRRIYPDIDAALHTGAERSILAALHFLQQQGRVRLLAGAADKPERYAAIDLPPQ